MRGVDASERRRTITVNITHKMTTRKVLIPFLFVYFFTDVNGKPMPLKSGQLSPTKDKETRFPLFTASFTTKDHIGQLDSTTSGVTTTSVTDEKENVFKTALQRPLSSRGTTNDPSLNSERKCTQENPASRRRVRRYSLHGSKLLKLDVKWTISAFSTKMTATKQIAEFQDAFKAWAVHCRLSFIYTRNVTQADIIIQFTTGDHNDGQPFDGLGSLLAHAYFPQYGSAMHFDDDENWVANRNGVGGQSLFSTALHEIGHSLGLRHSSSSTAVMSPILRNGRNSLTTDDILAIQAKYGKCTVRKVDAVMSTTQGRVYVFKNDWVWRVRLSTGAVEPGYPKMISSEFNQALSGKKPFQEVFYEPEFQTATFMFDKAYTILDVGYSSYAVADVDVSYTDRYTYYTFLKSAPDAAFVDPKSTNIYHFFIGSMYYKYDMFSYQLEQGYPKTIASTWPNVPNDLDTAFYDYTANEFYFIKDNLYFKFDSNTGTYYPADFLSNLFPNICPI